MEKAAKPYLIWSKYHSAWFRPNAQGYTVHIAAAGVFTDRGVDRSRERRVFLKDAKAQIEAARRNLVAEVSQLGTVYEILSGKPRPSNWFAP